MGRWSLFTDCGSCSSQSIAAGAWPERTNINYTHTSECVCMLGHTHTHTHTTFSGFHFYCLDEAFLWSKDDSLSLLNLSKIFLLSSGDHSSDPLRPATSRFHLLTSKHKTKPCCIKYQVSGTSPELFKSRQGRPTLLHAAAPSRFDTTPTAPEEPLQKFIPSTKP